MQRKMVPPKKEEGVPSPFQPRQEPSRELLAKIVRHLDLLRMPVLSHHLSGKCSRDCHIIERNHTVDAIKHFIDNGCKNE